MSTCASRQLSQCLKAQCRPIVQFDLGQVNQQTPWLAAEQSVCICTTLSTGRYIYASSSMGLLSVTALNIRFRFTSQSQSEPEQEDSNECTIRHRNQSPLPVSKQWPSTFHTWNLQKCCKHTALGCSGGAGSRRQPLAGQNTVDNVC